MIFARPIQRSTASASARAQNPVAMAAPATRPAGSAIAHSIGTTVPILPPGHDSGGGCKARPNRTGLPDRLKGGIETLSGIAMDDVRVHRNSVLPGTVRAYAYARGTDIHLAPGQERHLPHEAWHVVQQKQRRVRATLQTKSGVAINDDKGLEREADAMGARAAGGGAAARVAAAQARPVNAPAAAAMATPPVQGMFSWLASRVRNSAGPNPTPRGEDDYQRRTHIPIPPGVAPADARRAVTNTIGGSPAWGVNRQPSETPQEATTLGQPISFSSAESEGTHVTDVTTRPGHIFHEPGTGVLHEVNASNSHVTVSSRGYGNSEGALRGRVGERLLDRDHGNARSAVRNLAPRDEVPEPDDRLSPF